MKKILLLFVLMIGLATAYGQSNKTVGVTYSITIPTNEPGKQSSEVWINRTTGLWYAYDWDLAAWVEMGDRMQFTGTSGPPLWTPGGAMSRFAVNEGDSLYAYRGGAWRHLNDVPDIDFSAFVEWTDTNTVIATKTDVANVTVDLSGYPDRTELQDSAQAIRDDIPVNTDDQAISINLDTIFLEDGGFIVLPPDDPGTDDQTLALDGTNLSIEDGNSVDISGFLDNTDSQSLSWNGSTGEISISGGNTIDIDGRYLQAEVDGSTTNELQTLTLDSTAYNYSLNISSGNSIAWSKRLSHYYNDIGFVTGSGTANQLPYWVTSTSLGSLSTATYPNLTELSYIKGLTSSAQNQLNAKLSGNGVAGYMPQYLTATTQDTTGLYWTAGGRLGIGTQSPVSTVAITSALAPNSGDYLTVSDATSGNSVKIGLYYLSGYDRYPGIWLNQTTPSVSNYAFLYDAAIPATIFNTPFGGEILFRVNNSTKARIGSNGHLGVGGATPGTFATINAKGDGTTSATASLYTQNATGALNIYSTDDLTTYFGGKIQLGHPTGPTWSKGSGSPEGVVTAPIGSTYSRTDGGTNTATYRKESGTGNTGWVANTANTDSQGFTGSDDGTNFILDLSGTTSDVTISEGQNVAMSRTGTKYTVGLDRVLDEGHWTPTITAISNVDGTTSHPFWYERSGTRVTFWGSIEIDPTANATPTSVRIDLPIASNFTNDYDGIGSGNEKAASGANPCTIYGDTTNDQIIVYFRSISTANGVFYIHGSYKIQ